MLRESSKLEGNQARLEVITAGAEIDSGVPADSELSRFAEAALGDDADEIRQARLGVQQIIGTQAMIDAAGVIANFQRMVRIADGTGIPLDEPLAMVTAGLRDELGLNSFGSADLTPQVGFLKRMMGSILSRVLPILFRGMSK